MGDFYLLDQSHWNGRGDYTIARQAGAIATVVRYGSINAVTGECYSDYILSENITDLDSANFPYGAYFYMRPKFSGVRQGNFFVNQLRSFPKPKLPVWIDVEEVGDYQNILDMANVLTAAGYVVGIYTRQSLWDTYFPPSSLWSLLLLWAARWTSLQLTSPWSDGRFRFRDWTGDNWWGHQFSADGNGLASHFGFRNGDPDIDLSYVNFSKAEFNEKYSLETPVSSSLSFQVISDTLNVRSSPSLSSLVIGRRVKGDVVKVLNVGGNDVWVKDERGWSAISVGGTQYMEQVS